MHVVVAICLFALALLLIGFAIGLLVRPIRLTRHGVRTEGTITGVEENSGEWPIFTFADTKGRDVTVTSNAIAGKVAIGDRVPVLYLEDEPEGALIAGAPYLWHAPIALGGFAVLLTAVGVALLVWPGMLAWFAR